MIRNVLFDLDGTLLPMDQELFVKDYLKRLSIHMLPYGYDPSEMVNCIWAGTGAMVQNSGAATNESVFWDVFTKRFGKDALKALPHFEEFYQTEFQKVASVCGYTAHAAEVIQALQKENMQLILATNPIFPAMATHSRIRWAGLNPNDFLFISTYENSRHCKPNPAYYQDILTGLNLDPNECLMVGNDVDEDMVAEKLGLKVFLLTDSLINKTNKPIDCYPHGSFGELLNYIHELK